MAVHVGASSETSTLLRSIYLVILPTARAMRRRPSVETLVLDGEGQPEHAARAGAEGIARDNRDAVLDQKLAGEIERARMAVAELDEAIERAARVTCHHTARGRVRS